jgi:RNA polymerase sigma-70 factor (ECF subfamily)
MVTENRKKSDAGLKAGILGDAEAYRQFLISAARYLRRFIARRVPAADVEDVLQEILLSIHKARHTYDGKRSILPWISAIARYRLADYLRGRYAAPQHVELDEDFLPEDVTEPSELSEYISIEVEKLPERQQRIIYLMHTEGYTAKEVGTQLGMKESAVKVAAHRAYKLIKTRLAG